MPVVLLCIQQCEITTASSLAVVGIHTLQVFPKNLICSNALAWYMCGSKQCGLLQLIDGNFVNAQIFKVPSKISQYGVQCVNNHWDHHG